MNASPVRHLDTRGLLCPLPVLRARKVLAGLPVGAMVQVDASDPAALKDFPALCAAAGHALESVETVGEDHFRFCIRRGEK